MNEDEEDEEDKGFLNESPCGVNDGFTLPIFVEVRGARGESLLLWRWAGFAAAEATSPPGNALSAITPLTRSRLACDSHAQPQHRSVCLK